MPFSAVFARSSRTAGAEDAYGVLSGYVVALVQCATMDEVDAVAEILVNGVGLRVDGWKEDWYSVGMDLVAIVPSVSPPVHRQPNQQAWCMLGEQRACAILRAEDILRFTERRS